MLLFSLGIMSGIDLGHKLSYGGETHHSFRYMAIVKKTMIWQRLKVGLIKENFTRIVYEGGNPLNLWCLWQIQSSKDFVRFDKML